MKIITCVYTYKCCTIYSHLVEKIYMNNIRNTFRIMWQYPIACNHSRKCCLKMTESVIPETLGQLWLKKWAALAIWNWCWTNYSNQEPPVDCCDTESEICWGEHNSGLDYFELGGQCAGCDQHQCGCWRTGQYYRQDQGGDDAVGNVSFWSGLCWRLSWTMVG